MNRVLLLSLLMMLVVAAAVVEARSRGRGRGGLGFRRPGRFQPVLPPMRSVVRRRFPVLAKFASVLDMLMTSCKDGTEKQGDFLDICNAVLELTNGRPNPPAVPDEYGANTAEDGQGEGQNIEETQEYQGQGQPDISEDAAAEVDLSDSKNVDTIVSD